MRKAILVSFWHAMKYFTVSYNIAVTKEEPAWESFSEDEVVPPKPKAVSSASSSAAKPRKGAGKPGQGNIMSFFGKK